MFMKVYEWIGKIELQISKYTLGLMTILVFFSAIARTLGYPIAWGVDGATFLFAWCVFTACDVAMRKDKLVCVDILVVKFPKKVQYYIKLVNYILISIFLGFLIVFGIYLSITTRFRTFQGIAGFSYSWVTITVPFGSIMMLITTILKIREQIKRGITGFVTTYTTDQKEFL